jgi:hypothetical protein
MSLLAAVRPDAWNLPLFLHVLGAMALVGGVVLVTVSLVSARGEGGAASLRLSFRSLLWLALPAWIVMRAAAEWLADKEGFNDLDDPPDWIDVGYMASEPSFLLLIVATILAGVGARRAASAEGKPAGTLGTIALVLVALSLLLYLVAIWAMTTKPG